MIIGGEVWMMARGEYSVRVCGKKLDIIIIVAPTRPFRRMAVISREKVNETGLFLSFWIFSKTGSIWAAGGVEKSRRGVPAQHSVTMCLRECVRNIVGGFFSYSAPFCRKSRPIVLGCFSAHLVLERGGKCETGSKA